MESIPIRSKVNMSDVEPGVVAIASASSANNYLSIGQFFALAECGPPQFIHVIGVWHGLPICISNPQIHTCSFEQDKAVCPNCWHLKQRIGAGI
nr:unnamed protein product [Callosobruchus chinensis]